MKAAMVVVVVGLDVERVRPSDGERRCRRRRQRHCDEVGLEKAHKSDGAKNGERMQKEPAAAHTPRRVNRPLDNPKV